MFETPAVAYSTVDEKPRGWPSATALVGSAGIVATAAVFGHRLNAQHPEIKLGAAPLVGAWHWRFSAASLAAVVLAAVVIVTARSFVNGQSFRSVLVGSALMAIAFSFALAASDGMRAVIAPVVHESEYWDNLDVLPSSGRMLEWFAQRDFLRYFSVHLKGHPPGFILLLKGFAAIGLGSPWIAVALSYLGIGAMVIGVLVTVRLVVSDSAARRVAPFLALAPFSMWLGTSADVFFAGVGAISVALVAFSLTARSEASGRIAAIGAGLCFGALMFLTYAAITFAIIPAMITISCREVPWRARIERSLIATVSLLVVAGIFRGYGFWWFDGLRNTNWFYWHGTAAFRPWTYFLLANLGAALIALGPAVLVGIANLRRTPLWILVGASLACMTAAAISQYTKGEVERIWILFYPWTLPAVAVLRSPRRWLIAQALLVVVLQAALVSKW